MSFLFGAQDSGPSAAEILAEQRKQAEKRRQGLNQQAINLKSKGITGQLLGARKINPSQSLPGGDK